MVHEDLYWWRMACESDRVKSEKVTPRQPKAKFQHDFQILRVACCGVISTRLVRIIGVLRLLRLWFREVWVIKIRFYNRIQQHKVQIKGGKSVCNHVSRNDWPLRRLSEISSCFLFCWLSTCKSSLIAWNKLTIQSYYSSYREFILRITVCNAGITASLFSWLN